MSTRNDRAFRASRCILPIKIRVRQTDGSFMIQIVDVSVREDKRRATKNSKKGCA